MKAIIVDDELQSHEVLKNLLGKSYPDIGVVADAYNVSEGLALIQQYNPDLVFLDIEMPDGTGFDLLERIGSPAFYVIFITAHNEYAISAIRAGALDYLLKPVTQESLGEAMKLVYKKNQERRSMDQWDLVFEAFQLAKQRQLPTRMIVSTMEGIHYVPIQDIIRLEAAGAQTWIYIVGYKKPLFPSVNLGSYAEQLRPYPEFMQVHKSHIVNLLLVEKYVRTDGGYLLMKNEAKVPVSRMYRDELLRRLGEL